MLTAADKDTLHIQTKIKTHKTMTYINVCAHAHTHTHTYIHTHTHTHMYMQTDTNTHTHTNQQRDGQTNRHILILMVARSGSVQTQQPKHVHPFCSVNYTRQCATTPADAATPTHQQTHNKQQHDNNTYCQLTSRCITGNMSASNCRHLSCSVAS